MNPAHDPLHDPGPARPAPGPSPDPPESGEAASHWESSYDRLAQFTWLVIVLAVMGLLAFLTADLRRPAGIRPPTDARR